MRPSSLTSNKGQANGIEYFEVLSKGYHGIDHCMSEMRLNCFVGDLFSRLECRELNTPAQRASFVKGMEGKRLA